MKKLHPREVDKQKEEQSVDRLRNRSIDFSENHQERVRNSCHSVRNSRHIMRNSFFSVRTRYSVSSSHASTWFGLPFSSDLPFFTML